MFSLVVHTKLISSLLSTFQASDIVDLVMDMRSILMEELDSGIPDGDVSPVLPTTGSTSAAELPRSQPSAGTSSTYQKMLAKARAKKQN